MTMNNKNNNQQRLNSLPDKVGDYRHPADKPARDNRMRKEQHRQSLIERRIQAAMANGEFDNLPGQGKPLQFNKNPYLEPGQEWAFDLLKRNGFAPEWIERDKAIRQETDKARHRLRVAWHHFQQNPNDKALWQQAISTFTVQLEKLNRKIDDLNLVVPVVSLQRFRLHLNNELHQVKEQI